MIQTWAIVHFVHDNQRNFKLQTKGYVPMIEQFFLKIGPYNEPS